MTFATSTHNVCTCHPSMETQITLASHIKENTLIYGIVMETKLNTLLSKFSIALGHQIGVFLQLNFYVMDLGNPDNDFLGE
jgi:hypothetical protein